MWVRVTCPNGHRLKIETKVIGRDNRCPKCDAAISLWIQVVCPNGHELKVRHKHAGKVGKCPFCKEKVQVPDLIESIAMEILRTAAPDPPPVHQEQRRNADGSSVAGQGSSAVRARVQRVCPNCGTALKESVRTCPHCHKYVGHLDTDLAKKTKIQSVRCPECDAMSFPGDEVCSVCGAPLV